MNSRGPRAASGCAGENLCGKPILQLHYSAKTHSTFIIHFISARARSSFAQGQQQEKKGWVEGLGGGFYSPKEINVPDKWGFCPLGRQNANKYQIIPVKTLHSVKLCTEFENMKLIFLITDSPQN